MKNKKFRVWDKVFKAWLQFFFIGSDGRIYNAMGGKDITDEVDLVEYADHKESRGREVFEGDIVTSQKMGLYKVGVVEYIPCRFLIRRPNGDYCIGRLDVYDDLEVIGNEFENADLLKTT